MSVLHIVQSEDSGIPDEPQVFLDEEAAAAAYVALWREAYRLKPGEELPADYDSEWAGGGERGVRWWTVDAPTATEEVTK